jgi:outer membrane protein assembly factor BamB
VDELIRVVESKFAGEHIRIGGRTQEAAAFLRETRSATTASSTAATEETVRVPADGKAAWRSVFMSDTLAEEFSTTMQQTGWGRYMTSPDTHVPAAAVDAARVYVNWIGVVFAVDLRTGKLVWRTEKFSRFNGQTMSVVQSGMDAAACTITAADGRVFVVGTPAPPNGGTPSGNTLRCLDGATGKVLWNTQNAMGPTGTAVGRMVAGAFSGPTAAPDAAAAGKVSATPLSQYTFTSTALIDGPTLYVVGAPQGQANLELIAIDVAKGGKLWSLPLGAAVAGQNFRGQMQLPSAVLRMDSGTLYVLTNNGALLCVDTADQTVRWALRTEGPPQSDRENMIFFSNSVPAPVIEPPGEIVLSGGRLYIKEKATRLLYALDPSGPKLLWKRPLGKDQGIAGDRAGRLLTTGAAAEAIDAATHALLWSTPLSAKTGQMRPVFAGRTMLVQSARGIFMIDTNTGDVLKVFRSPDTAAVGANLLVSGDRLISVSNRSVTAYALVDEAAAK